MDTIKSALQMYLQDTIKAKGKTGLSSFDTRIAETRCAQSGKFER